MTAYNLFLICIFLSNELETDPFLFLPTTNYLFQLTTKAGNTLPLLETHERRGSYLSCHDVEAEDTSGPPLNKINNNPVSKRSATCKNPKVKTLSQFGFVSNKPKMQPQMTMEGGARSAGATNVVNQPPDTSTTNVVNQPPDTSTTNNTKKICNFEDAFDGFVDWDDCLQSLPDNDIHVATEIYSKKTNVKAPVIETAIKNTEFSSLSGKNVKYSCQPQKEHSNELYKNDSATVSGKEISNTGGTCHNTSNSLGCTVDTPLQTENVDYAASVDEKCDEESRSFLNRLSKFNSFSSLSGPISYNTQNQKIKTLTKQNETLSYGENIHNNSRKADLVHNYQTSSSERLTSLFDKLKSEWVSSSKFGLQTCKESSQKRVVAAVTPKPRKITSSATATSSRSAAVALKTRDRTCAHNSSRGLDIVTDPTGHPTINLEMFQTYQRKEKTALTQLYKSGSNNTNNINSVFNEGSTSYKETLTNILDTTPKNKHSTDKRVVVEDDVSCFLQSKLQNVNSSSFFSAALRPNKEETTSNDVGDNCSLRDAAGGNKDTTVVNTKTRDAANNNINTTTINATSSRYRDGEVAGVVPSTEMTTTLTSAAALKEAAGVVYHHHQPQPPPPPQQQPQPPSQQPFYAYSVPQEQYVPQQGQYVSAIPCSSQYQPPPPSLLNLYQPNYDPTTQQSVYNTTPASQQSVYNVPATQQYVDNVPATQQSVYNVPATQQSVYNVPATQQCVYNVPADQQFVYNTAPAAQQSVYNTAPATQQPVYNTAPATQQPVYNTAPATQQSVYNTAPATQPPVYNTAPATQLSVYNVLATQSFDNAAQSLYPQPVCPPSMPGSNSLQPSRWTIG